MNSSTNPGRPLPLAPVRWGVRVLATIAVAVAAYLAWHAYNLQAVVGCAPSAVVDCDLVLQSAWSKWIGIPVAYIGLASYITLLALSFFAGQGQLSAARWTSTTLVMFALVVAGAGLWFDSLQVLAIQKFCLYCIGVHFCGLTIAGLVLWSVFHQQSQQLGASRAVNALAGTFRPTGSVGVVSRAPARQVTARPSIPLAFVGAAVVLGILIGGQLLFPPKLLVSELVLPQSIEMNKTVATALPPSSPSGPSSSAEEHVVNRIPTDDSATGSHASLPKSDDTRTDKDHSSKHASSDSSSPKSDAPSLSRKVTFLKGSLTIDMYQQAVIGSPTAPHVVIEMVDYACPHCRAMHQTVMKALDRYGDQLAIVIMPMPLELECNKMMDKTEPAHLGACQLARLALAVSEVDPAAFVDFHEWMMADKDKVPPIDRAIAKAYRLADSKKLRERVNSDEINKRIQDDINLYTSLAMQQSKDSKPFGLPIQIIGDEVISGDTVSGDELLSKWEEILGMKPQ